MDSNHLIIRIVVRFVGALSAVGLTGLLILAWMDKDIRVGVVGIVGTLTGALCGLLTSPRTKPDDQTITDPRIQTMRQTTETVVSPENGS